MNEDINMVDEVASMIEGTLMETHTDFALLLPRSECERLAEALLSTYDMRML